MQVNYSVPYDTFVSLQPPFVPNPPLSQGLFFSLRLVAALAGFGFVLISANVFYLLGKAPQPITSLSKAITYFGLGAVPLLCYWGARRIAARRARSEHEGFLRDSYARLHCRDERFVQTTEDGLLVGCSCKAELRPWSDLMSLVETAKSFVVGTNTEVLVIPQTAFASDSGRTEFRAILSERLTQDRSPMARTIEFACTREDWRNARLLQFKAGGWIRVGLLLFAAVSTAAIPLLFVPLVEATSPLSTPFITGAVLFTLVVLALNAVFRHKPIRNTLPLKLWLSEDAIYARSPIGEYRMPWAQITGCLVDKKSLMLVQRGRSILLIPQRFIAPAQRAYIGALLQKQAAFRKR